MIVRRKPSVEGLLQRLGRRRISSPPASLSGGPEGPAGADGRNAGLRYTYLTNTEETDPGSGKLKFNKATLSEATSLRISETDGDGDGLAAFLATWDDSTSTTRGHLVMRKDTNPAVLAVFAVTGGVSDKGSWDIFTVAHVASSGAFANNDLVKLEFRPKGDKGDTGEKGANGANGEQGLTGTGEINCRLATAAALAAYTRTTNKLEANANGALATIDGVAPAVNDFILLRNGAAGADNGVYKVTSLGSGASKWTMERVPSMDASAECVPGMLITVAEGKVNADSIWQLTTDGTITLNTTSLTFACRAGRESRGASSLTYPGASEASNVKEIEHGLGTAVINVKLTNTGGASGFNSWLRVIEKTPTVFKVQAHNPGKPGAGSSVTFDWEATVE